MDQNKYIPTSYDQFLKDYPILKCEWLKKNIDAEDHDFDHFYFTTLETNKAQMSSFTYEKVKHILIKNRYKHIDNVVANFHLTMKTFNSYKPSVDTKKRDLITTLFGGDEDTYQLFRYLCENFHDADARFTDLTKFNQIYRFLNQGREFNINMNAFKELVFIDCGFDYEDRQISAEMPKHMLTLHKLRIIFKK